MTTNELRAASAQLVTLHARFARLFGRTEARTHSLQYLRGLLSPLRRKSVEPLALALTEDGDAPVVPLQRFLSRAPWQARAVQEEIQAVFAAELVPATTWPLGTVGVLDATDFVKQGQHSVGVARQHSGRLGKVANCQVGVFLVGVTPAGCALLDDQLYLPRRWSRAQRLRRQTRIPVGTRFRTKPALAAELVRRSVAAGHVHFDWLVADEDYGKDQGLLETLEARGQRYVMEVPCTTLVWRTDPAQAAASQAEHHGRRKRPSAVASVRELAALLPSSAWQTRQVREGSKGPLVFQFAAVRVWAVRHRRAGPPVWLLLRRSLEKEAPLKYYLSNAEAQTPVKLLAEAVCCRWRVDEWFEDSKGYLGMAQYEARSWTSWHHHMSLVALAHLYITLVRHQLKRKTPELTLDRTVVLLQAVLPLPVLTPKRALQILEYHLNRNRVARKAHENTWQRKHGKVKFQAPL
jgi:SRSO17 transposase